MGRKMVASEMTKADNYLLRSKYGESHVKTLNAAQRWGVKVVQGYWTIRDSSDQWEGNCDWNVRMLVQRGLLEIRGRCAFPTPAGQTALIGYAARKAYDARMEEIRAGRIAAQVAEYLAARTEIAA